VIDFIDMESTKNQREVENRLRDALRHDRARVQTGKISRFGLLELSRQRLRPALAETSYITCPRCTGTGHIRSTESAALHILRILEEEAMKENTGALHCQVPVDVATFLLNEKRVDISRIEMRHRVNLVIVPNRHLETPAHEIIRLRHDQLNTEGVSWPATRWPRSPPKSLSAAIRPGCRCQARPRRSCREGHHSGPAGPHRRAQAAQNGASPASPSANDGSADGEARSGRRSRGRGRGRGRSDEGSTTEVAAAGAVVATLTDDAAMPAAFAETAIPVTAVASTAELFAVEPAAVAAPPAPAPCLSKPLLRQLPKPPLRRPSKSLRRWLSKPWLRRPWLSSQHPGLRLYPNRWSWQCRRQPPIPSSCRRRRSLRQSMSRSPCSRSAW
jgi:hypothetical protein